MRGSIRIRLGIWLGERAWARPFVRRYSHTVDGTKYYVNRVSGTFVEGPKR